MDLFIKIQTFLQKIFTPTYNVIELDKKIALMDAEDEAMHNEDFEKAMKFVLKWEGGLSNDKADPGGLTKYGISKKAYPKVDIKSLTIDDAKAIYRKDYWDKCKCDVKPFPVNLIIFDTAVNCGTAKAMQFYRELGDKPEALIARREMFYNSLVKRNGNLKKFYKGWINRLQDLKLASGLS